MAPSTLLPRIARLPRTLADQIAAGEVIERPASVIKELVENSLDAGACEVRIEISRGGLESMRVIDDGHGIHPDDLALALERHATSKVRSQQDLEGIGSLGFRGEALPSIASVAALRLISRRAGAEHGYCLESSPGEGLRPRRPAAHPPGTTVEVADLFHAIPARRRFLRSERTEYLHVLDVVRRLALSRPGVGLRFSRDGVAALRFPQDAGADQRVAAILGRAFGREALPVDFSAGGMRIWGWLGAPGHTRSQSDHQYLFLNGRSIRDRLASHAIRTTLDGVIPAGRFAVFVLYLEMDCRAADVNVHPTKHEVRFRHGRDVHDFICAALRRIPATHPRPAMPAARTVAYANRSVAAAVPGERLQIADGGAEPKLGRPLAQWHGEFLITERGGHWLLVDLKAARRLLLQARLGRHLVAGGIPGRPLLVPVEMEVTAAEAEALDDGVDLLAQCGLRLEPIAPGRIAVRELPRLLPDADALGLARDVLAALRGGEPGADRTGALIQALLRHGDPPVTALPDPASWAAELRALEQLDLDCGAPEQPGVWRTLDREALRDWLRTRR